MGLKNCKFLLGMAFLAAQTTATSHAEMILHGTRVIYPSDAREVTLQMSNNGTTPSLVQAWLDDGDEKSTPDQSNAPFMITPPIARVEATKSQTLRITALPSSSKFDQTKETLLWLNVLDIPPKPSADKSTAEAAPDNYMQLAIRSRVKFFYRPSNLQQDASKAIDKLQWVQSGSQLIVKNPTPFYITMISIYQNDGNKKVDLLPQGLMLKPFSEDRVNIKNNNFNDMSYIAINDYGGRIEHKIKL